MWCARRACCRPDQRRTWCCEETAWCRVWDTGGGEFKGACSSEEPIFPLSSLSPGMQQDIKPSKRRRNARLDDCATPCEMHNHLCTRWQGSWLTAETRPTCVARSIFSACHLQRRTDTVGKRVGSACLAVCRPATDMSKHSSIRPSLCCPTRTIPRMTKTESGGAAVAFMHPPGRRKKKKDARVHVNLLWVRGQRVECLLGTSGMDHVRVRCCAVLWFLSGNLMHPELLTNSIIGCISVFGFVTNPGAPTGVDDTRCAID